MRIIGYAAAILVLSLQSAVSAPAAAPQEGDGGGPAADAPPEFCTPQVLERAKPLELSEEQRGRAHVHFCIAREAMLNRRYLDAIKNFRSAIALDPASAILHRYLAVAQYNIRDINGSRQAFARAVELDPRDVESMYRLAGIASEAGRAAKAVGYYNRIINVGRRESIYHLVALYRLAKNYRDSGDIVAAAKYYERLLTLLSDEWVYLYQSANRINIHRLMRLKPGFMFNLSRLYLQKGDNVRAIHMLKQVLRRRPADFKARALLVRGYIQNLDFKRARRAARGLIDIHPTRNKAYELLAEIHLALGKPEGIIRDLEKYRKRRPRNRTVALQLAKAYQNFGKPAESRAVYEKVLEMGGDQTAVTLGLARDYQAEGKPVKVLEVYSRGLGASRVPPRILAAAAEFISGLKEPGKVLARAKRLVTEDEKSAHPFLIVAILAEQAGKPERAVELYQQAIDRDAKLGLAYVQKADVLARSGKKEEALKTIQQAIAAGIKQKHLYLHQRAGILQELLGQDEAALDSYSRAIVAMPRDKKARRLLALLSTKLRRYGDAERELRTIIRIWPGDVEAYYQLAAVYHLQKKYEKAEYVLSRALAVNPKSPIARILLAELYLRTNRVQKATAAIKAVLKTNPNNTDARQLLAHIYAAQQDYKHAVDEVRTLIKAKPDNVEYRYLLAGLYLGMDDREKSEKALVDVLKMKPDFAPANNDLGYIWAERGVNLKKAEKMIRLAVKADPENPAYLDSLGWVLYKKGKFAKAAKWLGAAAKAAPHLDNVIWEHLGDVRLKLKDTRGAAEAWQKALDILQKKKDSKRKADSLKRLKEKLQNVPEGGGSLRDARPHGSAVALGAKALAQEVIE